MKNNIKFLLLACLIGLCLCCKQEKVPAFFDGEDVVYFASPLFLKRDSIMIRFTFVDPRKSDTIVTLSVYTMGRLSDKKRSLKISTTGSTAKEGEDFSLPEKIEIPANKNRMDIPVHIFRTPKLKKKSILIHLKLKPNAYFNTNLTGNSYMDKYPHYNEYKIAVTEFIKEPKYWKDYKNYLGPFSGKKIRFFAKITKETGRYRATTSYQKYLLSWSFKPYSLRYMLENLSNIKTHLKAQKDAGTPVLEENGTPMVLGPDA